MFARIAAVAVALLLLISAPAHPQWGGTMLRGMLHGGGGGGTAAYLSAVSSILPQANGSTAVNTTIPNGSSAILTWDSNGTGCISPGSLGNTAIPGFGGAAFGTATVSPTSSTTYSVQCGTGTAAATVTISGTFRDAAATYCAGNGGGSGTSASPWHRACIQAAVNAASAGDTVFLQGGNWAISTTDAGPLNINKKINLVGIGSGNTFDAYGHVNNGNGTDLCPVSGSSITCVYAAGTSPATQPALGQGAGYIFVGNLAGSASTTCINSVSNMFLDASKVTNGGSNAAFFTMYNCNQFAGSPDIITFNNIRHLTFNSSNIPGIAGVGQPEFFPAFTSNVTILNSVFAAPLDTTASGKYSNVQVAQFNGGSRNYILDNDLFYQGAFNPIVISFITYTRNVQYAYNDNLGTPQFAPAFGYSGAGFGAPAAGYCAESGQTSGQCIGDFNFTNSNNLFYGGPSQDFAVGGGVNDPDTSGGLNNLNWTGNWLIAATAAIDSCEWHTLSGGTGCEKTLHATLTGASISGTTLTFSGITGTGSSGDLVIATGIKDQTTLASTCTASPCTIDAGHSQTFAGPATVYLTNNAVVGMAINMSVDTSCNVSNGGTTFNITNNSIIATTSAQLNGKGQAFAGLGCKLGDFTAGQSTTVPINIYGFDAEKNYLQSPSNQYLTNASTISPVQTGNYCSSAAGSVTGCATSGFTTPPTCSFTLGTLSNGTVQFASTSFTAQYGAVQWLASTTSTTPLSSDSRWISNNSFFSSPSSVGPPSADNTYIPPVSLSGVSHGNTVYMWTMDSAAHVASCGSAAIP